MSGAAHAPRLARRLVRWALPEDQCDHVTADLDEVFRRRCHERSVARARLWYWREALTFSGRFLAERFHDRRQGPRTSEHVRPGASPRRGLALGLSLLDLKLGVRMLFKYPGLTLVSTLALSVAIAVVAGFHAGTEFMINPTLPVPEGDRVVAIWNIDTGTADRGEQTLGDMLAWREQLESLEDVGAFVMQERVVAAADGPTRLVRAAQISPSAFGMLRVPPLLGRALLEDDERPGGPAVALLGFELWQSAFGGNPAIVGKTIRVGSVEHTVVGVMPSGFEFPVSEQLWTPIRVPGSGLDPGSGPGVDFSFGRLAPDVTLEEAEAELALVGARLAVDHPQSHARLRPQVTTYARSFIDANEPGLATMMSAARMLIGIVLLVVAVNVGTLVYARSAARVGEIAVRMALGASRRRIALQMFAEALVLGSLAAVVGLAIMVWPLHVLTEVFSTEAFWLDIHLPFWLDFHLGSDSALLVVGLILLSAVLTGILPALKLTDRHMRSRLQRVEKGASGLRFGNAATAVVVSQVAISVALLTVGGAQLRTFIEDWVTPEDDRIAREEYLGAELRWDLAPSGANGVGEGTDGFTPIETWRALGRRVAQEPDVLGVTFGTNYGGLYGPVRPFETDGSPEGSTPRYAGVASIEPNYFDVYGAPIVAGRAFHGGDITDSEARVAIVNEEFVRTRMSSGQPIGQRIRPIDPQSGRPFDDGVEIVGVVRDFVKLDISQRGPGWVAFPTVYLPLVRTAPARIRMTVHLREDPAPFVDRLHAMAAELDPTMVVYQPIPLDEVDRAAFAFVRLYLFAVGFLVCAALLLSTTGVYSMMSFMVSQRTREIGIRAALGAHPGRVVREVFSRAMLQLGAGTVLGLAVGFAAANGPFALSAGLFSQGPGVMLAIAAFVLVMGLVGCGRPVSRALRIQPTEALRADG